MKTLLLLASVAFAHFADLVARFLRQQVENDTGLEEVFFLRSSGLRPS